MKLFISYSRDDKQYVYELADTLRDDGHHEVWIDNQRLMGADLWWEEILNQVEACDCFVVVLSPRCVDSIFCTAELTYALALNKPVLPLLLKPSEIPPVLKKVQYIDICTLNLSLERTLLRCIQSLYEVRDKLREDNYPKPANPPMRPPLPELQSDQPSDHIYEIWVAAEEAVEAQDFALAEKLFGQVVKADPQGLGIEVAERLTQIRHTRDCMTAYTKIGRLVENGNVEGARPLWFDYVNRRGCLDHDPRGYADLFSERMTPIEDMIGFAPKPAELAPGTIRTDGKGIKQVWVPPGRFLMGSDPDIDKDASLDEQPQHAVHISHGFWLDMYPVTNTAYQQFIDDDGYKKQDYWSRDGWRWLKSAKITGPGEYENFTSPQQPRVGISWYEADAYARWRGGRLPTEAEWEYAARGSRSPIYPWGDTWHKSMTNTADSGHGYTTPVGNYQGGKSWCGAYDIAGNVWEWVADWYDENYYQQQITNDPQGPTSGEYRGVRGGSWGSNPFRARAAFRDRGNPDSCFDFVGARMVLPSDSV